MPGPPGGPPDGGKGKKGVEAAACGSIAAVDRYRCCSTTMIAHFFRANSKQAFSTHRRYRSVIMGLFLSFVLLCLFVALLCGAAYAVYSVWYVGEERAKQQFDDASRQQKLLQEHNKRLSMMDANLSDSQRRALDDIQQRERLERRIEDNEDRIKRQAMAARLRNSAEEVRVRTQSVRLKNAKMNGGEEGKESKEGGEDKETRDDLDDDNKHTVRLGNAPVRSGGEGEGEGGDGSSTSVMAQDALHVTDGDVTRYLPIVAGTVWSADGTVRLGGLAQKDGGGGARVALGFDAAGRPRVEARDRLYAPHVTTSSLSVDGGNGDRAVASFPGAKSEHNPNDWRTYLGKAGPDGNNYLRGDTRVTGNLRAEGDADVKGRVHAQKGLTVDGAARLGGAGAGDKKSDGATIFGRSTSSSVDGGKSDDEPRNIIRGDTRFEGGKRIDVNGADLETRGGGRVRVRGGPADGALATLEAGFDGGARSALTFNGDSSPSSAADPAFDANKARWRVLADQGSGKDALRIDRTLASDHPDNDNDGGGGSTRWVPVSIEDGSIKLSGEVQACDRQGKNCRKL